MMPMDRQLPNGRRASAGARDLADSKRDCVDAQGFDFRFERLARNAELRRGARGPGDPSPRRRECRLNQLSLALGERGDLARHLLGREVWFSREPRLIDYECLAIAK